MKDKSFIKIDTCIGAALIICILLLVAVNN